MSEAGVLGAGEETRSGCAEPLAGAEAGAVAFSVSLLGGAGAGLLELGAGWGVAGLGGPVRGVATAGLAAWTVEGCRLVGGGTLDWVEGGAGEGIPAGPAVVGGMPGCCLAPR